MKVEATQTGIAKALKRWAKLRAQKASIEAERDQKLQPLKERFEQRCAPIYARAQEKLGTVEQELKEVEDAVVKVMLEGISADGDIRFTRVGCAAAVAEVVTREERELDPRLFFEEVPESRRDGAFYSCLKTLIGKAEKFLGKKRLDELTHAKRTYRVSINEL